MRRFALCLSVALALAGGLPARAETVGVTAAVNPAATGTPQGGALRTIVLGDNVVSNERIRTDEGGLVQILFVDGTTLTVGPRSDLVIDSFLYDRNAGTANVAVTMTKGALRFIGGVTSKTRDGAHISTPVGTIGIRGAVVDVVLNPPAGTEPHIDLLFGDEVTLERGLELLGRLYSGGYSLVIGTGNELSVIKTPPEWTSQMQQALSGRPGTSGGAKAQPNDKDVADSGVPQTNSGNSLPAEGPAFTDEELRQLLSAIATHEEVRNLVANYAPRKLKGAVGGILQIDNYDTSNVLFMQRWLPTITSGWSPGSVALTEIIVDSEGRPLAGTIEVIASSTLCSNCSIRIEVGADGLSGTATDPVGTYPGQNITASLTGSAQATLPIGTDYCTCDFLHWGLWEVTADHTSAGQLTEVKANGAWVVGVPTSQADLDTLGVQEVTGTHATFAGHAIGYAADPLAGPATLTAGEANITWSFAAGNGTMGITNFAGRNYSGSITGFGNQFAGSLAGGTAGTGAVRGGFFDNGEVPAAGAAGDFVLTDGTNWAAAGIFATERVGVP